MKVAGRPASLSRATTPAEAMSNTPHCAGRGSRASGTNRSAMTTPSFQPFPSSMSEAVVTRLMSGRIALTANSCISAVRLAVATSTRTTS